jgi:hypothetical protein
VPQFAGFSKDLTGSLDLRFLLFGSLLVSAVFVARFCGVP